MPSAWINGKRAAFMKRIHRPFLIPFCIGRPHVSKGSTPPTGTDIDMQATEPISVMSCPTVNDGPTRPT